MLTAISRPARQVVANKIPILRAFTLIDRSAGAHRRAAMSAVRDPAENTVAERRVRRVRLCILSEKMFRTVKLLLRDQRLMGIFRKAPVLLRNRELLFGFHIDLAGLSKYGMPQIDTVSQDALDRGVIPVIRGSGRPLRGEVIPAFNTILQRRNDALLIQLIGDRPR